MEFETYLHACTQSGDPPALAPHTRDISIVSQLLFHRLAEKFWQRYSLSNRVAEGVREAKRGEEPRPHPPLLCVPV